jgi:hypothetical protein
MSDEKPDTSTRVGRPKAKRTPYKYGGSLGWIASMIDPETSRWKPSRPKDERSQVERRESGTDDD